MRHDTSPLQRWQCDFRSGSWRLNVLSQPKTANIDYLGVPGGTTAGGLPDRGALGARGAAPGPPECGPPGAGRDWSNTLVAMAIMLAMSLRFAGTTSVFAVRARLPNCWI